MCCGPVAHRARWANFMKRELWTQKIYKGQTPAWPCPTCGKGTLALVPSSLVSQEQAISRQGHSHEAWDYDWVSLTFSAWFKCGNASCKEDVAVIGLGGIDPEYDEEHEIGYTNYYKPLFATPTLDIFELPAKCPDEVRHELKLSFSLFWSDESSAVARMRVALERLMDHLGMLTRKKNAKGKMHYFTLHERIEMFEKKEPVLGGQLMALKFLGNSGSHDSEIDREDLLDGYEVLEHVLHELVNKRSKAIVALAKKLKKKHGN